MAKILIAEDEPDIRKLISFTLTFSGHVVISTTNGEEAIQAVKEEKPDLIILDVRMPRMSGYEVCKQIKADSTTQGIPVIFVSAKGQEAEVKSGLEAGAEEYILKPFAPDELSNRVKRILSRYGLE